MRQDNSKILGFGLLALAAVLVMKGKKAPGVGTITVIDDKHQQRVDKAYKMLKDFFSKKYGGHEEQAGSGSEYFKFNDGSIHMKIRRSNHGGANGKFKIARRTYAETNLVKLTKDMTAEKAVDETIKFFYDIKEIEAIATKARNSK